MTLQSTEAECAANATAPRVSLSSMESKITARYDTTGHAAVHPDAPKMDSLKLLSICILVMKNGFTLIGKSAPASAANFNAELGRKLAYEDAIRQLWPLEGYALRERLTTEEIPASRALASDHLVVDVHKSAEKRQSPTICRSVVYYEGDYEAPIENQRNKHWRGTNGTREHPAVITHVHSDECVNLHVFFDGALSASRTSSCHLPDRLFAEGMHCTNSGWRWPARA